MIRQEWNDNWFVRCMTENGEASPVTLPHDAMITEKRSEKSLGIHNIGWFEAKDYEYTKHFQVPAADQGKAYYIEIEGAYHNAEVWINGEKAAFHPYGYGDFFVRVDPWLRFGAENEIRIVTRNADQPNSRWYSGTGLYRPVNLYIGSPLHILANGVRIRTVSYAPAEIEVTVLTTGAGTAAVQILDGTRLLAETTAEVSGDGRAVISIPVPEARLWSPEQPVLYRCRVTFAGDVTEETFGVRLLAWTTSEGLTINGSRVILRGACIHHDNGILGAAAYPEAEERKVRILKENGYNALRSAHNPCSKALLSACDRLGMLVMDEYVDVWYIHKTDHDYAGMVEQNYQTDLQEMVEKDYNHPSVILYSTGNEVAETAQKRGIRLTGKMTAYLHRLDPTRPVTCGINIFFNLLSSAGFGVYSDDKAKKEKEKAEKNAAAGRKKKAVGSEFYNMLAGLLGAGTMKIGATLAPCDWKTRGAYARMDIAGYNYGILRYRHDLREYPERLILGTETFCNDAASFWETAKKEKRMIGDFVWAGMDYIGEAGIGSWEYPDYAPKQASPAGWLTAGSGRIDILGNPNGEALYTKVAFEQTSEIFLAVKPVYQTGKHTPSAWKMTDAVPSWSYDGCGGMPAHVEVYARAYEVELQLNGRTIGRKRPGKSCRVCFETKYHNGTLTAYAYDAAGNRTGSTSLVTAGKDTRLEVKPEQPAVKKGGLVYLPMTYTDADGIWKPMEKHRLRIHVTGGRLLGFGNACPYNPDGYQKTETGTYYGRALAVVKADEDAEEVTVLVNDEKQEYSLIIPVSE